MHPSRTSAALAALCTLTLAFAAASASAQQPKQRQLPRGEYLATVMDCGGCHTGGALAGQPDPVPSRTSGWPSYRLIRRAGSLGATT